MIVIMTRLRISKEIFTNSNKISRNLVDENKARD
jgi:hypothetical protein